MRVLLDTHVFFWAVKKSSRLSHAPRQLIEDRANAVLVSAVSGWEIAVKVNLGKWPEAAPMLPGLTNLVRDSGFQLLDISMAHAERAGSLPLIHKDPFDRLLAAQALELDLPLLTVDIVFAGFGCKAT